MPESSKKKRTPAPQHKTRAQKNKEIRQEALREQLTSMKLIESIDRDMEHLDKIRVSAIRSIKTEKQAALRTQILAIKTRIQTNLAKLAKVLPDLKSTDIQGSMSHTHYNPSPSDRAMAAALGVPVDEYMEAKHAGELKTPDMPPLPERLQNTQH